MANIIVSIGHRLTEDEALRRVRIRIGQIKLQYSNMVSDLTENWDGYVGTFSGSARGMSVSGTVIVSPSSVTVSAGVPAVAFMFKGRIEAGIRDELTRMLA